MKFIKSQKLIILVIFLLFGSEIYSQIWTTKPMIPTRRWYPGCAELNGKLYVVGGQSEDFPNFSLTTLEVYDAAVETWEILTPMSVSRWGVMVVAYNGKIYAIGGLTGSFSNGFTSTNAVEEYNPLNDTWTTKSPMQTERGYGGAVVFNDSIYVFGGYRAQSGQDLQTLEKYYPLTDTWVSLPIEMPTPRSTFMTARVNNKVYFIGGWGSSLVEEFNIISGGWTSRSALPVATGGSGVAVEDSLIYIIGGRGGNFDEFQSYNTNTDVWAMLNPMPTPREGLVAGIVDHKVYCITGSYPSGYPSPFPFTNVNEEARDIISTVDLNYVQPAVFILYQNYPNPFNPITQIEYSLAKPGKVVLKIYNIQGKEIKALVDEYQSAGNKTISWNGTDNLGNEVTSGVYFFKLQFSGNALVKKMVLLR